MQHHPIASSVIASAGYCPDRRCLEVRYHNGQTWAFQDVHSREIGQLLTAQSPGKHLAGLKKRYRCVRCREGD